jgi:hypothetical protein
MTRSRRSAMRHLLYGHSVFGQVRPTQGTAMALMTTPDDHP